MTSIISSRFSAIPPVRWGEADPLKRGPLVCMDRPGAPRNCIGMFGGQYVLYRAFAMAAGEIDPNHIPDYTNAVSPVKIRQNPHWSGDNAIATFDPFGHLVPELFPDLIAKGINVRPTVAITKTTNNLPEIHAAIKAGLLVPDGAVLREDGRINTTKIAIEPAWHLPGLARYFDTDERTFREGLYYGMGGGPEGLLDPDYSVYLPPFGETTVYIMGDITKLGKPGVVHAARTHDKCGSSDTHGANICSCRPALIWGYEESIRTAQAGGIGMVVYTEAEGRGHGVTTKNMVYNVRMAGEDRPENYFATTVRIAGTADLRPQRLPTDIYRWLGISKIDISLSGSKLKTGAMRTAGIEIVRESAIPPERLEPDTAVTEWNAKILEGYNYAARGARVAGASL